MTDCTLTTPAPSVTDDIDAPALGDAQRDIDALCERWVRWCATRRLYGPSMRLTGTIGKLVGTRMRPYRADGPNAFCSAEMQAFHTAYLCQPDALDKRVFDLYYVHRVSPIKSAADALGIGRQHFYTVLADFRARVWSAAQSILQDRQGCGMR